MLRCTLSDFSYFCEMITAFFSIGSVEFYVMLVVVSAAIVALAMRPAGSRGPARQYFLEGILLSTGATGPELYIECLDSGDVVIRRTGLSGLWSDGALSLVVSRIGYNLVIEERLVAGNAAADCEIDTAIFTIDFLAQERYHLQYKAAEEGRFVAFTLPVKHGMWIKKQLPVRS